MKFEFKNEKPVMVETSARHVHVTQKTLETLFGEGFQLEVRKELSQPGQFASAQKVTVVGPKGQFAASILGPCRNIDQVEVSLTDARTLGVNAPIRESGDIKGSFPVKLVGPKGEVDLTEGCIVAKRHIHMTEEDAKTYDVKNGDLVTVLINSPRERSALLSDVVVRVSNSYALAMHIDTDEANALGLLGNCDGFILK